MVLTEDVLQEGIKYPLEGYIYPITYTFVDDIYTVDELTHELLNLTERKLNPLRDLFEKFIKYSSSHGISVCCGRRDSCAKEMPTVAGVFNRINSGMYLQVI